MKKLLSAALAALCLIAAPALAQVSYTDKDPNSGARITVPASPPTPLPVRGQTTPVGGGTITTPAGTTNYTTTNNLIANSATAGAVTPFIFATACLAPGGNGGIIGARVKTTDSGFAGKKVILKLHRDAPTYTNGDHGVWLTTESVSLGQISITLSDHFSDPYEKGVGTPDNNGTANGRTLVGFDCAPLSTAIYGELVAGETITPVGAKAFTAVLEIAH